MIVPNYRLLALVFVACCGPQAQAAPPTEVNVCGRDDAPGGVNLEQAMAIGGDIVVRCGTGPQTIEITRTYTVTGTTRIDGANQLTLTGTGAAHFFKLTGTLKLAGLTCGAQYQYRRRVHLDRDGRDRRHRAAAGTH